MDSLPSRCWQLSFIAWRWRRLLWIVLIAALLAGIGCHVHQFRRQKVVAKLLIEPATTPWPSKMVSAYATAPTVDLADPRKAAASPAILAMAAEESGLTGLWHCTRGEAATRLGSLLISRPGLTPPTIEFEVPKIEGTDTLKICEAIVRQAMFATTEVEQNKLRHEIMILESTAEATDTAVGDAKNPSNSLSGWLTAPGSPIAKDREQDAKRLLGESAELKRLIEFKQMELKYRNGPLKIADAPHWHSVPLPERMRALGITLAWSLGCGVLLAILLAYLAELLFPRRAL